MLNCDATLATLELAFSCATGSVATADGYALFSSLCRAGWPLHEAAGVQVVGRASELLVRCDERWVCAIAAAPRRLALGGRRVILDPPVCRPIPECKSARAAIVTVKGYREPDRLAVYLRTQLDEHGIGGRLSIGERRIVWVHRRHIVGFGVQVEGLSGACGRRLLARGLGGRRHFGCGVFLPC